MAKLFANDGRRSGKLLSTANRICELINNHQTVAVCDVDGMHEVAPIVRCKNCMFLINHPGFMDDGYCGKLMEEYNAEIAPDENWHCGYGKQSRKKVRMNEQR